MRYLSCITKMSNFCLVGREIFFTSFFRKADAALITFDLSDKKTFEHATKDASKNYGDFTSWVKETKLRLDNSRPIMQILGE